MLEKILHLPHLEAWASHQLLPKLHHMCRSPPKPKRTWRSHPIQVDLFWSLSWDSGAGSWCGVDQIWMLGLLTKLKEFQWFTDICSLLEYRNIESKKPLQCDYIETVGCCTKGTSLATQSAATRSRGVAAFSVFFGLVVWSSQSSEAACPSKNWKSSWQPWALTMKLAWRRPKFTERYCDISCEKKTVQALFSQSLSFCFWRDGLPGGFAGIAARPKGGGDCCNSCFLKCWDAGMFQQNVRHCH